MNLEGKEEEKEFGTYKVRKNLKKNDGAPKPVLNEDIKEPSEKQKKIGEHNSKIYYNNQRIYEKIERKILGTFELRNFHNWIKSVVIKKYCSRVKEDLNREGIRWTKLSVLEVGCGKGGDLQKYRHSNVGFFVGVDLAVEALKEAYNRYQTNIGEKVFGAVFIENSGSCSEMDFYQNIDPEIHFDIVGCQFAMHYMFESEASVLNFFSNCTRHLLKGGYLLLTIPDANVIVKRLREINPEIRKNQKGEERFVFGNKFYSLSFKSKGFPKDELYGLDYGFYLEDAVGVKNIRAGVEEIDHVTEYLVEFQNLVRLAELHGLELVEEENFHDFYNLNKKEYSFLFEKSGVRFRDNQVMDKNLWEISQLYKVVVFKKVDNGLEISKFNRDFKRLYTPHGPIFKAGFDGIND